MPRGRPRIAVTVEPDAVAPAESSSLTALLSLEAIGRLASKATVAAGTTLYERDSVRNLSVLGPRATATVQDVENRFVTLTAAKDKLEYDCTCPACADDGEFCSHCVAVAIAYRSDRVGMQALPSTAKAAPARKPRRNKAATIDDLRLWLEERKAPELVELIVTRATSDLEWRKMLLLLVAADSAMTGAPDIPTLQKAILSATKTRGRLDRSSIRVYLRQIQEIAEVLQQLFDRREYGAVKQLTAYAIPLLTEKADGMYDSREQLLEFVRKLVELHREAWNEASDDPIALAKQLYELQRLDRHSLWKEPTVRYAAALGADGIAEIDRLLTAEWLAIPPLIPKDGNRYFGYDSRRTYLAALMEKRALDANDMDGLIAVLERDLSKPERYALLSTLCRKANREDAALRWAEQGVEAFGAERDPKLTQLLLSEYRQRSEHPRALELLWKLYTARPHVTTYVALREYAEPIGQWPKWHEKALGIAREICAKDKAIEERSRIQAERRTAGSFLVQLYLVDGDVETASQIAETDGINSMTRLKLMQAREATHLEESLRYYRDTISWLAGWSTIDLSEIIPVVVAFRDALYRHNRKGDYEAFMNPLKLALKRKRSFMQALLVAGL